MPQEPHWVSEARALLYPIVQDIRRCLLHKFPQLSPGTIDAILRDEFSASTYEMLSTPEKLTEDECRRMLQRIEKCCTEKLS